MADCEFANRSITLRQSHQSQTQERHLGDETNGSSDEDGGSEHVQVVAKG